MNDLRQRVRPRDMQVVFEQRRATRAMAPPAEASVWTDRVPPASAIGCWNNMKRDVELGKTKFPHNEKDQPPNPKTVRKKVGTRVRSGQLEIISEAEQQRRKEQRIRKAQEKIAPKKKEFWTLLDAACSARGLKKRPRISRKGRSESDLPTKSTSSISKPQVRAQKATKVDVTPTHTPSPIPPSLPVQQSRSGRNIVKPKFHGD
jgi:hypothetical protein